MILTHYLSKASWRSKRSSVLSDLFLTQFLFTNFTNDLFSFKGFVAFQEKQCWRLFSCLSLHALDSRWCKSLRIKYWVTIFTIMLAIIIIIIHIIIHIIINNALDSRWCKSLCIKYWVIIFIIMLANIIITINMIT